MNNQQKEINQLVKSYAFNLKKYPNLERQNIIMQVSKEIHNSLQNEPMRLNEFLKKEGGKLSFLNKVLVQNDFQVLPKLKSSFSFFKFFIMSFLAILLLGIILIYFFIQQFLPLYKQNPLDNTISLLGGRWVLESDSSTYFSNNKNYGEFSIPNDPLDFKIKSIINENEFSKLKIQAKNLDLLIDKSLDQKLHLDCSSAVDDYNVELNKSSELIIKLKEMNQCSLLIPINKDIQISASTALINIKKIEQNIEIDLDQGHLSWKKSEALKFKFLKIDLADGETLGQPKASDYSKYQAVIKIKKGDVLFRN